MHAYTCLCLKLTPNTVEHWKYCLTPGNNDYIMGQIGDFFKMCLFIILLNFGLCEHIS